MWKKGENSSSIEDLLAKCEECEKGSVKTSEFGVRREVAGGT